MVGAQCGEWFKMCLEFPGGIVVRNLGFQCLPISCAVQPRKKRGGWELDNVHFCLPRNISNWMCQVWSNYARALYWRRGQQRMRWLNSINRLDGLDYEQTPGDSGGGGSLACCSPWGCKELDTT